MANLEDVFGVSGKHIKSYISREHVDTKLIDALRTDKQVIVYGASKQGKTALVSKYVKYEDNIVVSLSPKFKMEDIYKAILRDAGVNVRTSFTEGTGKETRSGLKAQVQATIAMFGKTSVSAEIAEKRSGSRTEEFEEIEFNLALPNDVASLVHRSGCKKVVILENFHYLNEDMQRQFAYDLRAFQDLKIKIIILGVWKEANRMSQFNGDLQDRVVEVPVEPWKREDFLEIARKGEAELNISFDSTIIEKCIDSSFRSVGVYQELLKVTCRIAGINNKQQSLVVISDPDHVDAAIIEKTEYYTGRHLRNLESIASGNGSVIQNDKPLPFFMPYYIIIALLELGFEGINGGVSKDTLMQKIKPNHHRSNDLRGSHLTSALKKLAELQSAKGITPPVLAYDSNTRMLKIIDSTFYFYLKNANLEDAIEDIVNPVECVDC